MRIANLAGRAVLLSSDSALALDIATASDGAFGPEPQVVWDHWDAFVGWARSIDVGIHAAAIGCDPAQLEAPSPSPSQVFAIGLNYADHAKEAGLPLPQHPLVFTKFPSSLTGPHATVALSSDHVDWEAELVVVIGSGGRNIAVAAAWDAIAGYTVGQDLSDRPVQQWGAPAAQFALGKSFQGYSPTGPSVVTIDELRRTANPDALSIACTVEDVAGGPARVLQDGNSSNLIFSVSTLVSRLSEIVELKPGDLIFSGTPAGVGIGRTPAEFLRGGQRLTTTIEGVGEIQQELTR